MHIISVAIALFLCISSCTSSVANAGSCTGAKPQKQAYVTDLGGIKVISLYGSWEEMGNQYGRLAGEHLRHVNDFLQKKIDGDPTKERVIRETAENLYSRYPYRFQQFFKGMENGSGLTLEDLKMNNAVEYSEGFFCSAIAVWNEYASRNLVYGRNYDAASYKPIAEDILITIFHPSDGSLASAIIGYAGEIYAVNGINEKGIFIELNNGMSTAGFDIDYERFASTTSLMEVLFDAADLNYLDAFFKTHRSFSAFLIGVADKNEARSYEWCTTGTENASGTNPEGLMIQTNHFVHPNWTYPTPTDSDSWNSITRRENLTRLAEDNKGKIDEETMCRIMETLIENGGATNREYTRYQLVFSPETMKLLVRVEQAPEWLEVDLKEFFL